jgi:hypothetical protein
MSTQEDLISMGVMMMIITIHSHDHRPGPSQATRIYGRNVRFNDNLIADRINTLKLKISFRIKIPPIHPNDPKGTFTGLNNTIQS